MLKLCHLFLKLFVFLCKMRKTSPKNSSRSCRNTFLGSQAPLLLYFAFFVLNQWCLAMFAGSGMVSCYKSSGGVADDIWQNCKLRKVL